MKIRSYNNPDTILFESESDNLITALQLAAPRGADLSGADLSGADLRGAKLRGANLECIGTTPEGYYVFLFFDGTIVRVIAGCKYWTMAEAKTAIETMEHKKSHTRLYNHALAVIEENGWPMEKTL